MRRGSRILTIEDEAAIRSSFVSFLEDCDFDMLEAENGKIGIELIDRELPDLILVDLRMPEVDGLTVLDYVSTNYPDIPVIAVSGTGNINDVIEALHYGAWDYILKPVEDLNILLYAVKRALEKVRLDRENREHRERLEEEVEIKTAQLKEANIRLQSINHKLKEIVKSTSKLISINRLDHFGTEILEHFGRHLSATGGSMYLKQNGELICIGSLDRGHAPQKLTLPLREGSPFRRVMESGKPLIVRDLLNGSCTMSRSGYDGYQDNSFLIFPIPGAEDRVTGLLSLHNKTLPPFTEEDQEIGALLTAFCSEGLRATMAFEALLRHEKKLKRSLTEKELLLREVHHRVKNNMQIIISMMNLQRPDYKSDHDRKLIDKSIHRIQAMALAHEQLYKTEDISQINLSEYIKGIVHEVVRGTAAVGTDIQVNTAIMEAYIGLELIIPVGIIIHELIDNALEHAFPDRSGGRVDVEGHYEGEKCILTVRDNGIGLPDSFDLESTGSLGFLLIKTLAAQIKGSIEVDRGADTKMNGEGERGVSGALGAAETAEAKGAAETAAKAAKAEATGTAEAQGAAFTLEFVCLHS